MSVQRWFSETEAVVQALSEFAELFEDGGTWLPNRGDSEYGAPIEAEEFAAIWQAAELLSRAYSVLLPMVQFEQSKAALNLPDVQKPKPKQPKKAHLYGADGKPLS